MNEEIDTNSQFHNSTNNNIINDNMNNDNINNNNISNDNMNNDNINNENINNNDNMNNINNGNQNNYMKKYTKITISFIIIFFINLLIEIYSHFKSFNSRKYVFQFSPINEKWQYYRFVTSYFIHFGFGHKIVEFYITFKLCYILEDIIGTLITISLILISMIMNNLVQFLLKKLIIYIFTLMHSVHDLNYDYQGGFTSVLFTMFTFYLSFNFNKRKQINILSVFILSARYFSFTLFIALICLTPNKSFFGNISGIINGYLIKFLPFIFLPRIHWVYDFEKKFGFKCEKFEYLYRSINKNNHIMVIALNELQKNSMNEHYNYGNDFINKMPNMNESMNNINDSRSV
jgi:membrane associated rhomboid family serine protease